MNNVGKQRMAECQSIASKILGDAKIGPSDDRHKLAGMFISLVNELLRAEEGLELADEIRAAQRAYMADRGNNEKGRAVAEAAAAYDAIRDASTVPSQDRA